MCGTRQLPLQLAETSHCHGDQFSFPPIYLLSLLSYSDSGMWKDTELNHPSPQILSLLRPVSPNAGTLGFPQESRAGAISFGQPVFPDSRRSVIERSLSKHRSVIKRESWYPRRALHLEKALNAYSTDFSARTVPSRINTTFNRSAL